MDKVHVTDGRFVVGKPSPSHGKGRAALDGSV